MVQATATSAHQATASQPPRIFQRRGVAVHVGAAGVTLTPAVQAIVTATERPFRAPVRINN